MTCFTPKFRLLALESDISENPPCTLVRTCGTALFMFRCHLKMKARISENQAEILAVFEGVQDILKITKTRNLQKQQIYRYLST